MNATGQGGEQRGINDDPFFFLGSVGWNLELQLNPGQGPQPRVALAEEQPREAREPLGLSSSSLTDRPVARSPRASRLSIETAPRVQQRSLPLINCQFRQPANLEKDGECHVL